MKNKKGAIEISMTTIIVVVIGITLLSLGLMWVRNTLGSVNDLSEDAFNLGQQQIQELFLDSDRYIKIIPDRGIELEKGDTVIVGVMFYNIGDTTQDFQATVEPVVREGVTNAECFFAETGGETTNIHTLAPLNDKVLKLHITTSEAAIPGFGACNVELTSPNTGSSESDTVTLEVVA